MSGRAYRRSLAGLAFALAAPAAAAAQAADLPYGSTRALNLGGELSATVGPPDSSAFFNYTDYERNTLRLARVRLFAEWRPAPQRLGSRRTPDRERHARRGRGRVPPLAALAAATTSWSRPGRIPPVVGVFSRRAYGRDNLVMGMPLAYQYLTSLRPDALPATLDDVLRMRAAAGGRRSPSGRAEAAPGIPLVSATRWDTGVRRSGGAHWFEASGAVTRGAPAVPVVRDRSDGQQWSGRAAVHLPDGPDARVSGARGAWIDRDVLRILPPSAASERTQTARRRRTPSTAAGDGWSAPNGCASSFQLPLLAAPASRHRAQRVVRVCRSRAIGCIRAGRSPCGLERLAFGPSSTRSSGSPLPWDAPVDRVEAVVGFRATRRLEVRAGWQHNWRSGGRVQERGFPAVQAFFWF